MVAAPAPDFHSEICNPELLLLHTRPTLYGGGGGGGVGGWGVGGGGWGVGGGGGWGWG